MGEPKMTACNAFCMALTSPLHLSNMWPTPLQRCLLRFATQYSFPTNSVVHPPTRHTRLITVAKLGVLKLTFNRPAHLHTITAAVSPGTLVVTARATPLHLFSTTD